MRFTVLCLLVSAMFPSVSRAQGPVFAIIPEESDVKFFVKASVAIDGKFNKWEATLTFPSPTPSQACSTSRFMQTPLAPEATWMIRTGQPSHGRSHGNQRH